MLSARCGTRSGYANHRKLGEPYCDACRKANSEASKLWHRQNKDKSKMYRDKYAAKTDRTEYFKRWYQENKDKITAQQREYYSNNKDKSYARSAKRRAVKLGSKTEPYTAKDIIEIYGPVCHICNDEIDMQAPRSPGKPGWEKSLHLDHIIPLSKGGTDTMDNIKPAHGICNLTKSATVLVDVIC